MDKLLNERGNINLALILIMLSIGLLIVLTSTIVTLNNISSNTEDETTLIYQKESARELTKYGIANALTNLSINSFDTSTELLNTQAITDIQTKINNSLTEVGSDYSITITLLNTILVDDVCDNLYIYDGEGNPTYTGMYCDYTPLTIELEIDLLNTQGVSQETTLVTVKDLYLYEETDTLQTDSTLYKIEYY